MIYERQNRAISISSENRFSKKSARLSRAEEIEESDTLGKDAIIKKNNKKGHPYLDEEGNICQDKMEVMEHVEYDTQIHCQVKLYK